MKSSGKRAGKFLILGFLMLLPISALAAGGVQPFGPAELQIETPDGKSVIGHSFYNVRSSSLSYDVTGEAKLNDGQHDVETERLELRTDSELPVLDSYSHEYFAADGSPMQSLRADFRSGEAVCTAFSGGKPQVRSATFNFQPDTYAGASLVLPITYALRQGQQRDIRFHALSCIPDPKVMEVRANVTKIGVVSADCPGANIVQVEAKPYLGWYTFLAAPFLPKFTGYFDAANGYQYVGGVIQRYYKGPMVRLVNAREPAAPSTLAKSHTANPTSISARHIAPQLEHLSR